MRIVARELQDAGTAAERVHTQDVVGIGVVDLHELDDGLLLEVHLDAQLLLMRSPVSVAVPAAHLLGLLSTPLCESALNSE